MNTRALFFILISLAFVAGCATTNDLESVNMKSGALEKRIAGVEDKTSDINKFKKQVLSQQAELQSQFTEIQSQLMLLKGQLEQITATPISKIDEVKLQQMEEDIRLIKEKLAIMDPVMNEAKSESNKKLYDSALEKYKAGDYAEAAKQFESFLSGNPKTLADNANFWLGECYFEQGKYEEAILKYDVVVKEFPKGLKMPDALLKEGVSFIKTGDKVTGKAVLNRLVKDFPKSDPAKKAKAYIK